METQTSLTLSHVCCKGTPYLLIICLDYILWTAIDLMKENGFTLEKASSRRYSTRTFTDTDYTDDIALLANTLTLVEIFLHVYIHICIYIYFLFDADIHTLHALFLTHTHTYIYIYPCSIIWSGQQAA